jgi:hypothetical protein
MNFLIEKDLFILISIAIFTIGTKINRLIFVGIFRDIKLKRILNKITFKFIQFFFIKSLVAFRRNEVKFVFFCSLEIFFKNIAILQIGIIKTCFKRLVMGSLGIGKIFIFIWLKIIRVFICGS